MRTIIFRRKMYCFTHLMQAKTCRWWYCSLLMVLSSTAFVSAQPHVNPVRNLRGVWLANLANFLLWLTNYKQVTRPAENEISSTILNNLFLQRQPNQ